MARTDVRAAIQARLTELDTEAAALRQALTVLGGQRVATRGRKRGRRKMSAAQKKAVSARMKKLWAERRKKAAKG
jgi:hypothetical protein